MYKGWVYEFFNNATVSVFVWQGKGALGCALIFICLRKCLFPWQLSWVLLYNLFFIPVLLLDLCHFFHKPELKLQGYINFKVSFAHWVIFRIQEGHCLLCTMDTCQGLVAVNLIGLDFRFPQCSENCKHDNGLVYFFGFFFYFYLFKCTMEVWNKCRGSYQTIVIF